jgi:hypothetical protein
MTPFAFAPAPPPPPAPAPAPAPAPQIPTEFFESITARMNELREAMEELRELRAQDTSGSKEVAEAFEKQEAIFAERFQQTFDEAISRFSEQFDRKLQESDEKKAARHVEAAEVVLDSLFDSATQERLDSNLERIEVKRSTGSGIAENLERLKSLTRKKGKGRVEDSPS